MSEPKRLLTIGHSYVVAGNRRLAHEMALAGAGEWEVTVAAPERFPGDLREITLEPIPGEACRVVPVPVKFARMPHLMRYGRRLTNLLRRERWDVIHCWQEPFVVSAAEVARLAPKEPALVYATFQNLPKRYPIPFSRFEKSSMARADGWIAFGHTVEETLADRSGYRARMHRVIAPGVDTGHFHPDPIARRSVRQELRWDDDERPVVGYLGRFVREKGIGVMIAALAKVSIPHRVLLVGGGEMEDELSTWAERSGGAAQVVTGVPHDEVPAYLNAMDVLVAPSLTTPRWREQFGRMLTEAIACGVPVVGSDSGEIPHVIGDAGIITPEGDAGALAVALNDLIASPERRADLSRRGLERVRAEFALPVVARRHLDFFDAVLARKRDDGWDDDAENDDA
ncbi:MAG TPA: glycosyltransferase family 4 protein [Longimicrobium sp.]|nr:glycosyltransferase family 4 protein [Longimicrobium sp.]